MFLHSPHKLKKTSLMKAFIRNCAVACGPRRSQVEPFVKRRTYELPRRGRVGLQTENLVDISVLNAIDVVEKK